jgi:diadenosine tetraphosphatase ApaH/serine/threonine PP2A family protein phosphatase
MEHPAPSANGHLTRENCPEPTVLQLVTFIEAAPWRLLTPDDAVFGLFLWVWRQQPLGAQHSAFWEAAMPLWPRKRGHLRTTEYLALWVWNLKKGGLDHAEIAERLHYSEDTLRRRGVFRQADEFDQALAELRQQVDAYDRGERTDLIFATDLPLVWAPDLPASITFAGPVPNGVTRSGIAWAALTENDRAVRRDIDRLGKAAAWS